MADYVDFYSSLEHATNLGRLFRPDAEPLLPNWRHLPVGYHGRAGTVVVSGTRCAARAGSAAAGRRGARASARARGWTSSSSSASSSAPRAPSASRCPSSARSTTSSALVLVNDWSARDLQAWEYQPLGPFLGKSFATSIGAWVTPLAAVLDRRVAAPAQAPEPLAYLREEPWALDVALEVELNGTTVARTNARHLYWSFAQQIAHLTSNGARLRTGDLLASGTISGPARASAARSSS